MQIVGHLENLMVDVSVAVFFLEVRGMEIESIVAKSENKTS